MNNREMNHLGVPSLSLNALLPYTYRPEFTDVTPPIEVRGNLLHDGSMGVHVYDGDMRLHEAAMRLHEAAMRAS
jgi:hypothetical protein